MIVTIDGPSGTGKSTLAKGLADRLDFTHFDTGALYRAIAWKVLEEKIQPTDIAAIKKMLKAFEFDMQKKEGRVTYLVSGHDVTTAIRSEEVTKISSEVAALACVREALRPLQESFAKKGPCVFEGRDLGTIVFPHADIKFFLTARPEVRAERRLKDLQTKFPDRVETFSLKEILENINKRDADDASRPIAPLKQAEDALLVDVSDMTIEEALSCLEKHVKEKT